MNSNPDITELLSLISQPAFYVCDERVSECNDAAQRLLIAVGTAVSEYLTQDVQLYNELHDGCLILPLQINGILSSATATRFSGGTLFVLDAEDHATELKTLSMTAANMRQPLSAMIATANSLAPLLEGSGDSKVSEHMERFNRNLYQMHRMLCNMSDVFRYTDRASTHMKSQNIVTLVGKVFQRAQALAKHCDICLEYSLPDEDIMCLIDEQLLERGVFNMISNAMKFSEQGGTINASLIHREKTVYITVQDNGPGISPQLLGSIFQRYRRQPGLEDIRFGLGLGLALVRCAATVHGGTVLLDSPDKAGARITMSIPIRKGSSSVLRSKPVTVDYAGGWDHALLELSDVLPSSLYRFKN